uniref:Uncharacterized protein LOC104239503 n=1 Tax=Nicotiana sylvestris TaxID=4096 RepID=A0A1U7Y100_NICSY|nr:PREDICTED: uncharacterized protein LOC104239503 [Nicotiana sylvestris]
MPLVVEIWNKEVRGNAIWVFHQKMKSPSHALSLWSRQQHGNIFQKVKKFEQKVKDAEITWAHTNNDIDRENLNELKAQYVRHLKVEQDVLKQKTQLQWFKEGDANSRYFHSLIRGRRRKLYIHKIKNEEGEWIQGDENIGKVACEYFHELFSDNDSIIREDLLSIIPTMITNDDNDNLTKDQSMIELKEVVFSMNPSSAAGPDGMNGKFFEACWEVIKEDLLNVVLSFFKGIPMPR